MEKKAEGKKEDGLDQTLEDIETQKKEFRN